MTFEFSSTEREKLYNEYLQEIAGIKFTFREVDVISCILHNRGEKKIASILSISYRTVSSHIRSIMGKLGCNSREFIIDSIENSGRLQHIRQYYFHLITESLFNSKLQKIAKLLNNNEIFCLFNISNITNEEKKLLNYIIHSLKIVKINTIQENNISKKIQCYIHIFSELSKVDLNTNFKENACKNIILLFNEKDNISLLNNLNYVDFRNNSEYYLNVFKLIEKIIDKPEVVKIFAEFKIEYQQLQSSYEGTSIIGKNLEQNKSKNIFHKKKSSIYVILIVFFILLLIGLRNYLLQTNSNILTENIKNEVWNLPQYPEYYSERRNVTKAIWDKFNNSEDKRKTAILAGLHGLGGVGKTTLAKNAIHNSQLHYTFKGWFSAETKSLLQADYFELGEKYHLFTKDMSDQLKIIKVKDWLEQQENILLVYDNVPDMEILEKYLPNKGHIIITSRNYRLPGVIEIDVMIEDEAISLLDKLITKTHKQTQNHENDIALLAKELGYLPLALSQAGTYIAENMLTIQNYLSLYTTEKNKLLSTKTMSATDKHESVYVTWDISLKKILEDKDGKKALVLLDLITYCYPEYIPQKLLIQYLCNKVDNGTVIETNEVLSLLKQYSLVKGSSNSISVHRLVHSWLKSKHSQEQKITILKNIISVIKAIYPWKNKTIEDITFVKLLFPHIEAVLLQTQLLIQETEYVDLLSILGNGYHTFGDYNKSKKFFERTLSITKKQYGDNSIEVAKVLHDLGKTNIYLGNYINAKELLTQALSIKEKHFSVEHIEITDTLHHLGRVYLNLGDYIQSRHLLEKALLIKQKYYGTKHIETIHTLHQLGRTYLSLGNYIKAKELLEQVLSANKKYYGNKHTETARALYNLGRVYLNLSNYTKAKELLEQAFSIREKHFGLEHIETNDTLHHLGRVYLNLGDYAKAKELLKKSLLIYEKHYGTEHIETISSLYNLGRVYLSLGNHTKVKGILEQALLIHEKYNNSHHLLIANISGILGIYYLTSNKYDKSKELFEKALDIIVKQYGTDNVFTAKLLANLGNVHRLLGNNLKSKKLLEQALIILKNHSYYDNLTNARILGNIGLLYSNLGDKTKKKDYLEKALLTFREHLYLNHADIKMTTNELTNINTYSNFKVLGYPIILLP